MLSLVAVTTAAVLTIAPAGIGARPDDQLAGVDRYETAAAVIEAKGVGAGGTLIVSSGEIFADALSGGPLAAPSDAAMLLVHRDSVPAATEKAMRKLAPRTVLILGGTGTVSERVAGQIAQITSHTPERIAGADRYETSALVAQRVGLGGGEAVLASGESFPDALCAGALAAHRGVPILLTRAGSLPAATAAALQGAGSVTVVGGTGSVSQGALAGISQTTRRIAGADRYETAALIAREFGSATQAHLVDGSGFADALVAAQLGGPVLLTVPNALNAHAAEALVHLAPSTVRLVGGACSEAVLTTARERARSGSPAATPVGKVIFRSLHGDLPSTHAGPYIGEFDSLMSAEDERGFEIAPISIAIFRKLPAGTWTTFDMPPSELVAVGKDTLSPVGTEFRVIWSATDSRGITGTAVWEFVVAP